MIVISDREINLQIISLVILQRSISDRKQDKRAL